MIKKISYMALGLFAATQMNAQGVFSNTELGRSTEALAKGGASTSMEANAFSVFENASSSSFSDKTSEIGVLYSPWAMNMTKGMDRNNLLLNVAGYYKAGVNGRFLAGFSYYRPGGNKMFVTDNDGNPVGDEIRPAFYSINLGYAHRFGEHWSGGLVAKFMNWNNGYKSQIGAVAFDVTVTRRFDLSEWGNIDLSVKASDWGTPVNSEGKDKYDLPSSFSLGGRWDTQFTDVHKLNVGIEGGFRCLDEKAWRASGGLEYTYNDMVSVRGGYYYTDLNSKYNSYASVGLGGKWNNVTLDVTYLIAGSKSALKNTFMIGAGFSF